MRHVRTRRSCRSGHRELTINGSAITPAGAPPAGPGGPVDLAALAEIERSLVALATSSLDRVTPGRAQVELAATSALSSVATVLWFDALRAADRVSVTPNAGPLVRAVHTLLAQGLTGGGQEHGTRVSPRPSRPVRSVGTGAVGPSATVWAALARRYASARFDVPPDGRHVCVLDDSELRDAAVWEAVTDERAAHLGELLWVVAVTGATPSGELAGAGGGDRAARLFDAAGWQVLTLRHGRHLAGLFQRPGGGALEQRLATLTATETLRIRKARGADLRRRLAGSGPSGVGISRLLDTLTDDQVIVALHDLGGHDLPLLIDAFDDADPSRPTVLFAHVDAERLDLPEPGATPSLERGRSDLVRPGSRGAALATMVGGYLDRPLAEPARPPVVPTEPPDVPSLDAPSAGTPTTSTATTGTATLGGVGADLVLTRRPTAPTSTQAAFGTVLDGLRLDAPEAAEAVVTVSSVGADRVVSGWMRTAAGESEGDRRPEDGEPAGTSAVELAGQAGGRHVAGALSPGAFGGVLSSLARAWSRLGLALFPIGVADETTASSIMSEWGRAADADARSLLVVADTAYPAGPGEARWTAPAATSGAVYWQPAFAQDVEWVTRAALGGLATATGLSHVLRLSARAVDQRLAAVPTDPLARRLRRAQVLAGAYPLRDGGPFGALTLVGLGAVVPEVLRAADELEAILGRRVGVVCVTSPDLLFRAVQARRGLARGSAAVLDAAFPNDRRTPIVTVTDGDAATLAFLAGMRGDQVVTLGSTAADPSGGEGIGYYGYAQGSADAPAPVHLATIVGAALDLLDD